MRNGMELGTDRISWLRPGQNYYQHSTGPPSYATMSLPLDYLAAIGPAILGRELTVPTEAWTIVPSPDAMARLQRLHMAATTLAEDAPQILAHPQASRGLEQALIEAMINCLGGGKSARTGAAYRQARGNHAAVLSSHRGTPRSTALSSGIVPCDRGLGEDAARLLQRAFGHGSQTVPVAAPDASGATALREGIPGNTTVTEIATRYGFWQFGRLAIEYKALFGEAPSATLAREPD